MRAVGPPLRLVDPRGRLNLDGEAVVPASREPREEDARAGLLEHIPREASPEDVEGRVLLGILLGMPAGRVNAGRADRLWLVRPRQDRRCGRLRTLVVGVMVLLLSSMMWGNLIPIVVLGSGRSRRRHGMLDTVWTNEGSLGWLDRK